jgi:hypothetical protein
VAACCEMINEPSFSIKAKVFLYRPVTLSSSSPSVLHAVSCELQLTRGPASST